MTFELFQEQVTAAAKDCGLTSYELYYTASDSKSVSALGGEIDGFSSDGEQGASFRCIVNGKMGYASTELFTAEEAKRIVAKAVENASTIESDNEVFIFAGSPSYREVPEKKLEEADLKDLALKINQATLNKDPRVEKSSSASASMASGVVRLVNSEGLNLSASYCRQGAGASAVVRSGEEMFNAYERKMDVPFSEIDPEEVAKTAVDKAIDKIVGKSVPSGKYDVVYDHDAFGSLLMAFSMIFSAKSAQQGMSLLKGKEGQQIAKEFITIVDDPFCEGYERAFDGEGVATYTKNVVENGVFKTLLYNLETAKKAGVETTGNASRASYSAPVGIAPFNFYIKPGTASQEELFEKVGNGLLITDFAGLHSGLNPITGDFSLMASGYRIENGKKTTYVNGITVSDNFYEVLKNVEEVGSDLEFGFSRGASRIGSPSILARNVSVAGK